MWVCCAELFKFLQAQLFIMVDYNLELATEVMPGQSQGKRAESELYRCTQGSNEESSMDAQQPQLKGTRHMSRSFFRQVTKQKMAFNQARCL